MRRFLLFVLLAILLLSEFRSIPFLPTLAKHSIATTSSSFAPRLHLDSCTYPLRNLVKMKCICGNRYTTQSHFTRHQYVCSTQVDAARRAWEESQARHRDKRARVEEQENSQPVHPPLQSAHHSASERRAFFSRKTVVKPDPSSSVSHSLIVSTNYVLIMLDVEEVTPGCTS
jgi:hypothetical protein